MEKLHFNNSPAPTIGVELEIQLLDGKTLDLTSMAPEILKMVPSNMSERIKPEFIQSMVEINTGICSSVAEVEGDLLGTYRQLEGFAESLGVSLFTVSLHPFSSGHQQEVSDHPRYRRIMDELQLVGRRFITQGLHVHIGIHDKEKVVMMNNMLRIHLPVLLALTTSSPFYESMDTGLMSYRAKLFEALPLAGMPDSMGSWSEFEKLIHLLRKSGIIESVKDIWWDVRPHPDFGTVEIRVCDLPYCFEDILAITAMIQALVVTLSEQDENSEPHSQILRSNKWQAARYGLEGVYVDPFVARKHTMKEAVMDLYNQVRPAAAILKSTKYLDGILTILERKTGAHLQKKLYYDKGRDFPAMIRAMQELFLT